MKKDKIIEEKDNLNSSKNIKSPKVKESKEDDDRMETLKKEMEKKFDELKKEISGLNNRIKKLETNQLLLYHQINMYKTSRDIYKSIYYYFFD